ncbi:hypothetical protein FRT60_20940 [Pseudomonas haemolytica]|uniref:Reverse transcriptase domain-containing protein n=1 Tax=Pseudomonas haemolytica TaxID=2600065 RepID=A0A646P199_9PSED|nr:hypothetical protein [Pseudomonas haemolytica]
MLSNILLYELDKELARRGHRFVRYADNANILCAQSSGRRASVGRRRAPLESASRNLMRLELSEERACKSAFNGRSPWWNSGARHMNQVLPKKLWDRLGLVSILDTINRLNRIT